MYAQTLTAQEKHQLLSVLRELDRHSLSERRRFLRRVVHIRTTIRTLEFPASAIKSVIVNVSRQGAALLIPQSLPLYAKFFFPIRFSEGGGWLVLCEGRNCVPQPRHQWRIGARFLDYIDDPRGTEKPPLDWLV
jgi:hypothetical protein